jgi:phosphoglycerol transferase MdoB-like AlkP superfamily enzyme
LAVLAKGTHDMTWSSSFSLSLSMTIRILKFNLLVLFCLTLLRVFALFYYGPVSELPFTELLVSLYMGVRFDSVILFYAMAIPVLLLAFCWLLRSWNVFQYYWRSLQIYYWVFLIFTVFLSFVNFKYYSYFQDHINIMIFGFLEDDTAALVRTFLKNYPVLTYGLLLILISILLWKAVHRLLKWPSHFYFFRAEIAPGFFFALILSVGLGARGSFGLFPLSIMDTVVSTHPFLNYLCFNGFHGLQRAIKLKNRESSKWNSNAQKYGYENAASAMTDATGEVANEQAPFQKWQKKTVKNVWAESTRPHVLVVVMESFGGHWLKYQNVNFDLLGELSTHWKSDLVFENFFPSSPATIGSLANLMVGLPHRPFGPFLTESLFLNKQFVTSAPMLFKNKGYQTRFIYGGNPGWRDIDKFARKQGFETVEGQVDIEKSTEGGLKQTHDWGVYDADVFNYALNKLKTAKNPQLILIMTTTNHPPYEVPKDYKVSNLALPESLSKNLLVEKSLAQKRFEVFRYANDQLGKMISHIKSDVDLAQKTVIAATGDHGFMVTSFSEEDLLEKWKVPLYLFLPDAVKPREVDTKAYGSHMDIFPTIYPLVFSETEYWAIGRNILQDPKGSFAFHNSEVAVSPFGGVMIRGRDQKDLFLQWENGALKPVAEPSAELVSLSKKYKGTMSALDFFMHDEVSGK